MTELYLRLLDRVITPVLTMLAVYLFLRGHNNPGGGFIAGLVIASALQLQILSRGNLAVRRRVGPYLHPMLALGLLLAAGSAILGLFFGSFFKGLWLDLHWGPIVLEIGTPVVFDLGVLLVVTAVVSSYLLGLSREDHRWFP